MLKLSEVSTSALLADLPEDLPEERFDVLLETPVFRLERILSKGHATPEGQWYDQDWHEWVLLLQGQARLAIEGRDEAFLQPGDALLLPAHCRHRVNWTPEDTITVWLALHYGRSFASEPTVKTLTTIGANDMTDIRIEKQVGEDRLKSLGVRQWPIWSKEPSEFPWTYDETETCYLLEGRVIVTPEGGEPVEFGKGDLVTFWSGLQCTWKILETVRKHYNFS